jgi:hypothetical protein
VTGRNPVEVREATLGDAPPPETVAAVEIPADFAVDPAEEETR